MMNGADVFDKRGRRMLSSVSAKKLTDLRVQIDGEQGAESIVTAAMTV